MSEGFHTPAPAAEQPESFSFTEETLRQANAIIAKYPEGRQASAVIPVLDLVQRQDGWVSTAAMDKVAALLDMPEIKVYEVATFYTMFNLRPAGEHHIEVCTNLACWLKGSDDLMKALEEALDLHPGGKTGDGKFSLAEAECLGACVNAPMCQIGDHYYEDLTPETIKRMVQDLKDGKAVRPGPQSGRRASEPAGGATTLTAYVEGGA